VIISRDYRGENLVFIVGCPRSGTTWVQRLLSRHPRVVTGQESNLFNDSIGLQLRRWRWGLATRERGGVGLVCYFTESELLELLRDFMAKLLQRMLEPLSADQIFVDKTPDHALYVAEILELLPASRIIHVIRDPRDVVASLLAASRTWASESSWAPRYAWAAARTWMKSVNTVRKASRAADARSFLELRYEELHRSPVENLRRVADFMGLTWSEEEMLAAVEATRFRSAGDGRSQPVIPLSGEAALVSGPRVIDPEGFLRRGRPGSWKSDLSLAQKLLVWMLARDCARANGYEIGLLR
jgi:hypothetical protein